MGICSSTLSASSASSVPPSAPTDLDEVIVYTPDSGYVISVYDGDTFSVAVWHSGIGKWCKYPVRVAGIDCPEMRTKNTNERTVALQAKSFTEGFILKKHVELRNASREKFGRILADVYVDGKSLGAELLKNRLAVPYFGDAKKPPEDWVAYRDGGDTVVVVGTIAGSQI